MNSERNNVKTEILAPAGSFETMKAVIAAGADAVYMGLNRFSARAYADNAASEDYAKAIDYAHLHGKKLYLTINTLFKERELFEELFPMLAPLYKAGLDAVIVQDLGAMKLIRMTFPDLPVHVSTQAAVTGPESAAFYAALGVTRIVPAREMSLQEIRKIADKTGLEMECFVHGALCYSYSGQCLFSSIVGGRSGNRGRCAQPCRMPYQVNEKGKPVYVLSLKDLNTLELLPDLVEAGVYSFKIEGRMKKAEYAAGVTSIYRKYMDLYLGMRSTDGPEEAKRKYRVDPEDQKRLFELFNRKGFTDGYYRHHNGEKMLTLTEPDFREKNSDFLRLIEEEFIRKTHKSAIKGFYSISSGAPLYIHVSCELDGHLFEADAVSEELCEKAAGRSAEKADVVKSLGKLGNTDFVWAELDGELEDGVFLPVGMLNAFRRKAVEAIAGEICRFYQREEAFVLPDRSVPAQTVEGEKSLKISALIRTGDQFKAALRYADVICLDSTIADDYKAYISLAHQAERKIFLAPPQIMREKNRLRQEKYRGFDGILLRSLEGYRDAVETGLPIVTDHNIYAFNSAALAELSGRTGILHCTVPVELNAAEIEYTGFHGQEMIVYGRLPMMVSANCVKKSTGACDHRPSVQTLKDRMGNVMPVLCDCANCMNTIYNALPLNLLDSRDRILKFSPDTVRLNFTFETEEETEKILQACVDSFRYGKKYIPEGQFTRGHFKRGVE